MEALGGEINFCDDCIYKIYLHGDNAICGLTNKRIRFYDRACDRYRSEDAEWDEERNAYIL